MRENELLIAALFEKQDNMLRLQVLPIKLVITNTEITNISSPVNGMIVYDTFNNKFKGYENGAWVNLI